MKKSNDFFLLSLLIFLNGLLFGYNHFCPPDGEKIRNVFGIPIGIPIVIITLGLAVLLFILGKNQRKEEKAEDEEARMVVREGNEEKMQEESFVDDGKVDDKVTEESKKTP